MSTHQQMDNGSMDGFVIGGGIKPIAMGYVSPHLRLEEYFRRFGLIWKLRYLFQEEIEILLEFFFLESVSRAPMKAFYLTMS